MLLAMASVEAALGQNRELLPEHLFLALCKSCDMTERELQELASAIKIEAATIQIEIATVAQIFSGAGVDVTRTRRRLRGELRKNLNDIGKFEGHRSEACRNVCRVAESRAAALAEPTVQIAHFLYALLREGSPILRQVVGERDGLWTELCAACQVQHAGAALRPEAKPAASPGQVPLDTPLASPEKHQTSTPLLDKLGRDLTSLAREGKLTPCIGRKGEIRSVAQALRRQTKNNPVLVGEPGVGKTCIAEGLALRIVSPDAQVAIRDWRIVEVSMASLIAGCMYQGQFEERLQTLVNEVRSEPNLILFMDELHTLVGAGGASGKGMDAGQVLKPALARGEVRLIGATTTAEYRKHIEPDAALERRFQLVWVDEPSREEAIEILEGIRPRLETHHNAVLDEDVIEKTVEWSMRYLPDHRLPDKAIDVIDQACAAKILDTLSVRTPDEEDTFVPKKSRVGRITVREIAEAISRRCRIPVSAFAEDEGRRLLQLENALSCRVKGQDHAISTLAEVIRTARAGIKKPNRPVGVFLFAGATGTGKTELAKALAEFLFGSEDALIRFDMSEYAEKHNVARLIGAPPGYIGYDEEGQLTGRVRNHPYCVVLFDEIEKAHQEVFNIFLQIFDDGRLTDSRGRRTLFTESIIIMTSNLGASHIGSKAKRPLGVDIGSPSLEPEDGRAQDYERSILGAIRGAFRPELLNRINHIIVFRPLSREVVTEILGKLIEQLNASLADRRIVVEFSQETFDFIVAEGYSEAYGARELERVFERRVATPLARAILDRRISAGSVVCAKKDGDDIGFEEME
jgi:ATP-dependent Clp protease ATP-binding subunit ClpC